MFHKFIINNPPSFDQLSESLLFENVAKGRVGATITKKQNNTYPIVRTTTNYDKPAQNFKEIHYQLIQCIKESCNLNGLDFNNAMIEIYDNNYKNMKFHTDQSLDLVDDSFICVFSCYQNNVSLRKLLVKSKINNNDLNNDTNTSNALNNVLNNSSNNNVLNNNNPSNNDNIKEYVLNNNSAIIFSTQTNKNHIHKIILDNFKKQDLWLGITLRLSKTYITFYDNSFFFTNTFNKLATANNDEKREFFKNKGLENQLINFDYPTIYYTISKSDLMIVE